MGRREVDRGLTALCCVAASCFAVATVSAFSYPFYYRGAYIKMFYWFVALICCIFTFAFIAAGSLYAN